MTDRTHAREYADRFHKYGSCEEHVHQTRALCQIADMLTNIAYDIRAIRKTNTAEGDTE